MSDSKTDRSGNAASGELLTRALVENGISEVSLVLLDDLIVLERNLPWRVEMAIQRLAKDLKVLPMFRGESDDGIRRMKLQIVQDILRPLRQPEFLRDLVVNCHVIASHVQSVRSEDIESALVDAFPLGALLPTSQLIFTELERLRELDRKAPGQRRGPAAGRRGQAHPDVGGAAPGGRGRQGRPALPRRRSTPAGSSGSTSCPPMSSTS